MPTVQTLKEEFYKMLLNSKMYSLLEQEKQQQLLLAYQNATDDQFIQAIAELKNTELDLSKAEQETKQRQQQQVEMAQKIKTTYEQLKKVEIQEQNKRDAEESAKAAQQILEEMSGDSDQIDVGKSGGGFWNFFKRS